MAKLAPTFPPGPRDARAHFRAHERKRSKLTVSLVGRRSTGERQATIVDISLAGAGLATEEALVPGDRLSLSISTPNLWDPLVLSAVVRWAQPEQMSSTLDVLGRPRRVVRAGVRFDHDNPRSVLGLLDLIGTLRYE